MPLIFPFYKQTEAKDCGPACIKMVAKYYGRTIAINQLRELGETDRTGSNLLGISEAAEKIGFNTLGVRLSLDHLKKAVLPCIIHWRDNHYVVLHKLKKGKFFVADPAFGMLRYSESQFLKNWIGEGSDAQTKEGVALLLEPLPTFDKENNAGVEEIGLSFVVNYLVRYRQFVGQLIVGLLVMSLIQLTFPFLTQSILDVGVKNQDMNFIFLILGAQLLLYAGKAAVEAIQAWILLHLSTRLNISLVSDFFIKLMRLPLSYFDRKLTGDLLQRINDHERLEKVLTSSFLTTLFSLFNLIIFSFVLAFYSLQIFLIFLAGSIAYFGWIALFLARRKALDHMRFSEVSREQSKVVEMINGMQEIRLHNASLKMRWSWEFLQARLFRVEIKSLTLEQVQKIGSNFLNEIKNILITVIAAKLVIDGEITLGMMLAISYITGQLNGPITQLIGYIRDIQDARISLQRLNEIHTMRNEEDPLEVMVSDIPKDSPITLSGLSFRYGQALSEVLKDIELSIPVGKTTAIVGVSGSGKTTLLKILLGIYKVQPGMIRIGATDFNEISMNAWRSRCGVVMQEGYIFNDTIANNIAIGQDAIDKERLALAVETANIKDYIEELPKSYNTLIGNEGLGLSTGQKQRLLLARAVYKNPEFLFLDEATSALDAKNERVIMQNLNDFLKNRTAIIIAHRLSTVKNADQIIVLGEGKVVEYGTHSQLIAQQRNYYELIKDQLELGN